MIQALVWPSKAKNSVRMLPSDGDEADGGHCWLLKAAPGYRMGIAPPPYGEVYDTETTSICPVNLLLNSTPIFLKDLRLSPATATMYSCVSALGGLGVTTISELSRDLTWKDNQTHHFHGDKHNTG